MNPILCAVDTTDTSRAAQLARGLKGVVGGLKLGLEFFTANGAMGVAEVAKSPIFLDLKFHDIPNTVAKAVKATAGINAFMMTVHASGGSAMMRAAAEAAKELPRKPKIVGVTLLTSLDQNDLGEIGMDGGITDQVKRLADLAQKSGLDGVVCSPHEIAALKRQCGKEFILVVPGIRPDGSGSDDQKRTMTPKEAVGAGADYLVIGRPITGAADPAKAAEEILRSLK